MVSYCLLCTTRSWKLPFGLGIGAILLGSLLFLYPSQALTVMIYLIGAIAVFIGIVLLFIAWLVSRAGSPFALLPLVFGIAVFALGAAAFIYPEVVGMFIAIIIAVLCIIAGLAGAFTGGFQKGPLLRRAAISIGGIALAALGVAILLYPELTTTGIMQILGAFILIAGVVSLIGSVILWIRMRSCMPGVIDVQDQYRE
jgi:uncharacterized membrane protein HdeD (DUF308 family)